MSSCWWPHGLQHARLPCPLRSPGACSNSCPLSQWCHPTISSSVAFLLLQPSIFPSIRVFPNELALPIFFFFFFLAVLGLCCCRGFSLVVASRSYSLLVVCRLLIVLASLVVACRLSCSTACGIFPDQGSNPCLLHWQAEALPLSHQRSPK